MESATVVEADGVKDTSGIGGHPAGLTTLFFTEMWERLSYYGMRAILVYYMTAAVAEGGLSFDDSKATDIYGWYTMSVYLTPLIGGWLADRFLGARLAVLIGGIIIASGHFSMAFASLPSFYLGLTLIAAGTGLLKPNISTMVGSLYGENDPRRDSGFSIFYMGINIGAMLAPLVCGTLAQDERFRAFLPKIGFSSQSSWHWGFAAAGVGMTLGLIQFLVHRKRLAHVGGRPQGQKEQKSDAPKQPFTSDEIKRLLVIGILFFFSILFWMVFEQAGSSFSLFAERQTSNTVLGFNFPSSWFQSVNSVFILILAPLFSWLWIRMGNRQPTSPGKFSIGLVFVGLGSGVLAIGSSMIGSGKVSPMWLIAVYFLHTVGELCLSPVGLSSVTKLAPARVVGLMMGVWFLSISLGSKVAGWAAGFYKDDPSTLFWLFGILALVTIVAGGILVVLTPSIKKMMGRVH